MPHRQPSLVAGNIKVSKPKSAEKSSENERVTYDPLTAISEKIGPVAYGSKCSEPVEDGTH
jgi:hypothetical protein